MIRSIHIIKVRLQIPLPTFPVLLQTKGRIYPVIHNVIPNEEIIMDRLDPILSIIPGASKHIKALAREETASI